MSGTRKIARTVEAMMNAGSKAYLSSFVDVEVGLSKLTTRPGQHTYV
jgi:hypothetical protein